MERPFDFIEMKIPSKSEYLGVIRLTLSGIASRMGYTYGDIEDLKIATSEAVTNAVHHAYEGENGEITIGFGVFEDHLQIIVSDSGKSFDLDKMKDELGPYNRETSIDGMNEGGLGLFLIDSLMDDVKINNHAGVSVLMKKYIHREQVRHDGDTISTKQTE